MFNPTEPVTPNAIARWFGVTPNAIHNWARRGITWTDEHGEEHTLKPADFNGPRNGARYWITDLRNAEMATRSKTQRSHRRQLATI